MSILSNIEKLILGFRMLLRILIIFFREKLELRYIFASA